MDESQIHLNDLHRILFGNAPVEFMLEVLVRTVIIYICLLVIVTRLGKRMAGQLTIAELGIAIMLGAIVSPPMETPERGIVQGIFILVLVLLFHQWVAMANVKYPRLERITQGKLSVVVKDGVLQLKEIHKISIARAQLMAVLRKKNIHNLGKVKRMYMEASGIFSVYEYPEARPGLSLLPVSDDAIHAIQTRPDERLKACTSCGNTVVVNADHEVCKVCGQDHWDAAVL